MKTSLEKIFNNQISGFHSATDPQPKTTTLGKWLLQDYPRLKNLVLKIRSEQNKAQRDRLKKMLPGVTVSGLFQGSRKAVNLVQHSGMIALDFDGIRVMNEAREVLSRLDYILYAGLSCSGRGLWAVVPISEPESHLAHFRALQQDFKCMGLQIDNACSDVSRLRFYSFDENPIINQEAIPYAKLVTTPEPEPANLKTMFPVDRNGQNGVIGKVLEKIEREKIDITSDYSDWLSIAGVLVHELGEMGRPVFHRLSRFYPGYNYRECERQFNRCMRNRKPMTVNLLMHILKKQNVFIKTY